MASAVGPHHPALNKLMITRHSSHRIIWLVWRSRISNNFGRRHEQLTEVRGGKPIAHTPKKRQLSTLTGPSSHMRHCCLTFKCQLCTRVSSGLFGCQVAELLELTQGASQPAKYGSGLGAAQAEVLQRKSFLMECPSMWASGCQLTHSVLPSSRPCGAFPIKIYPHFRSMIWSFVVLA